MKVAVVLRNQMECSLEKGCGAKYSEMRSMVFDGCSGTHGVSVWIKRHDLMNF